MPTNPLRRLLAAATVTLYRNDWKDSPVPWNGIQWERCDRPTGSTEGRWLPRADFDALLDRLDAAEAALEFYGDERAYEPFMDHASGCGDERGECNCGGVRFDPVMDDKGAKARDALSRLRGAGSKEDKGGGA